MLNLVPALAGLLSLGGLASAASSSAASYKVQTPPLTTDWTFNLGTNPWTEYPRPQMVRDKWQNLNGIWSYKNASAEDVKKVPTGDLGTAIMVPSCIESALSGECSVLNDEQSCEERNNR